MKISSILKLKYKVLELKEVWELNQRNEQPLYNYIHTHL